MKTNTQDAAALDRSDPLRKYRGRFVFPEDARADHPTVYLTGNSLGLKVRGSDRRVNDRLQEWASLAVRGWHETDWMGVDRRLASSSARIVGAKPEEVCVSGTLTGNLHALLISFFRPTAGRSRVLMEHNPFPSDRYAVASQAGMHGLDPEHVVLEAAPIPGGRGILEMIERHGPEIAVVLIGGINYYSGEAFDVAEITRRGQAAGCLVGIDLAHAAGNISLELHDWGVDFAAWCGYKYLNGGPGAPAGLFVHERHHNTDRPRLAGWWGHDASTRFAMPPGYVPEAGAAGWQTSTPPILGLAPLEASLALFDEVGIDAVVRKSRKLTGFLESLLASRLPDSVEILTPQSRGAQLSLSVRGGHDVFERLSALQVVCDWREPDVIRVAPAPLYNSFQEMEVFVDRLGEALRT